MLRRSVACRWRFSSSPQAAKPWARLAQPNAPRAGPTAPAARVRSRYAERLSKLRSAIRAVTSAMTGCTLMGHEATGASACPQALAVLFTRVNLGPDGDYGRRGKARGRLDDDGLARHQRDTPRERADAAQRAGGDRADGLPAEHPGAGAGARRNAVARARDQRAEQPVLHGRGGRGGGGGGPRGAHVAA